MRKIFFLLIGIVFLSCEKHSGLYLKAEFENTAENTKVFIGELTENYKVILIDTAFVKKGKILVDLPEVEDKRINILSIEKPKSREKIYFINENEPVKIKFFRDSLNSSIVEGGESNISLQEYMKKINEGEREYRKMENSYSAQELKSSKAKNQLRIKQKELDNRNTTYRRKLLEENPENIVNLIVFSDLIDTKTASVKELKRIYDSFSEEIKSTGLGKQLGKDYVNTDPLAIGNIAPTFSAKTPEGEELALEEALGKYTLVDFWAAWCMPCRRENPNLVKVYEKYQDKGFNILGVSFDRNERSWINAIEKDGLEWDQISNLSFWNDPIAKMYKIRSIPANILLDEEGRIIAKNLRGRRLQMKMEELLGK